LIQVSAPENIYNVIDQIHDHLLQVINLRAFIPTMARIPGPHCPLDSAIGMAGTDRCFA
jgi:hypothetical protein